MWVWGGGGEDMPKLPLGEGLIQSLAPADGCSGLAVAHCARGPVAGTNQAKEKVACPNRLPGGERMTGVYMCLCLRVSECGLQEAGRSRATDDSLHLLPPHSSFFCRDKGGCCQAEEKEGRRERERALGAGATAINESQLHQAHHAFPLLTGIRPGNLWEKLHI